MKSTYPIRTRFANEIVAEIVLPKNSRRIAVIFCDGLPGVPNKSELLQYFASLGCIAVHPRYRGSWESGGEILRNEPTQDVHDVITGLQAGFTDAYSGEFHHPKIEKFFVIGGSFGGPASILSLLDNRVSGAIAIAPIVDWTIESKSEPKEQFETWVKEAFFNGYRFAVDGFERLYSGRFYQPVLHTNELQGRRLVIIHASDDSIAPIEPVREFARNTKATLIELRKGGHLSPKILLRFRYRAMLKRFLYK